MDKYTLLKNLASRNASFCCCELLINVNNPDTFEIAYRWVQSLPDCHKSDPCFFPSIQKINRAHAGKSPQLMREGLNSLCIDIIHC
ncbi:MAG: hypothetical protein WCH98_09455 [Verrucomicrobiota bacterium]